VKVFSFLKDREDLTARYSSFDLGVVRKVYRKKERFFSPYKGIQSSDTPDGNYDVELITRVGYLTRIQAAGYSQSSESDLKGKTRIYNEGDSVLVGYLMEKNQWPVIIDYCSYSDLLSAHFESRDARDLLVNQPDEDKSVEKEGNTEIKKDKEKGSLELKGSQTGSPTIETGIRINPGFRDKTLSLFSNKEFFSYSNDSLVLNPNLLKINSEEINFSTRNLINSARVALLKTFESFSILIGDLLQKIGDLFIFVFNKSRIYSQNETKIDTDENGKNIIEVVKGVESTKVFSKIEQDKEKIEQNVYKDDKEQTKILLNTEKIELEAKDKKADIVLEEGKITIKQNDKVEILVGSNKIEISGNKIKITVLNPEGIEIGGAGPLGKALNQWTICPLTGSFHVPTTTYTKVG
jgi:hypothetical protein